MTKVVDKAVNSLNQAIFILDFSPPRGGDCELLKEAKHVNADFLSIAYNPGKSVRVNSAITAHWIKKNTGQDVIFNLATRDMNKIAIQSLLLGAQLLGLENLVVVKGDKFSKSLTYVSTEVNDFTPTKLINSIYEMNRGVDFKGHELRSSTNFCIGASIDLHRNINKEIILAHNKVKAGAQYLLSQATFTPQRTQDFIQGYTEQYGENSLPIMFHGIQVMNKDDVFFGKIPKWVSEDLSKGRSGDDIALQVMHEFREANFKSFYIIPSIAKGGKRDYNTAQNILEIYRNQTH